MSYGIQTHLFSGNGPLFLSKLFAAVCKCLHMKEIMTTANQPQTNCKVKLFQETIVRLLPTPSLSFCSWTPDRLKPNFQPTPHSPPLQFQGHHLTGLAAFGLVLSLSPPNPVTLKPSSSILTGMLTLHARQFISDRVLRNPRMARTQVDQTLKNAQIHCKPDSIIRFLLQQYLSRVNLNSLPAPLNSSCQTSRPANKLWPEFLSKIVETWLAVWWTQR